MSSLFEKGFFVREPAWHGMGEVLPDYIEREEAMKLAGHDHKIIEVPVYIPEVDDLDGVPLNKMLTWKALARDDNKEIVHVAPSTYKVIQNDVPWDIVDAIAQCDNVKYETAGMLEGSFSGDAEDHHSKGLGEARCVKGQVYWVLAWIDEPLTVPGDNSPLYPYIFATWSHDGSQAMRVKETSVRVVCANTQSLALMGGRDLAVDISIKHTKNADKRIKDGLELADKARESHREYIECATQLAKKYVTEPQINDWVEYIIPVPEMEGAVSDRVMNNVETARGAVRAILNGSEGTVTADMRNTAWGLLQTGVEYFDHVRKYRNNNTYFKRNLMKTEKVKEGLVGSIEAVVGESIL